MPATKPITIKVPLRIAFPSVFTPVESESGPKFQLTILVPKTGGEAVKAELEKLVAEAIQLTWPDPKTRPARILLPLHDGDSGDSTEDGIAKGTKYAGFANHWYANVASKFKPGCIDKKKAPVIDPEQIYGGIWMYIQLSAYSYDNKKKGISFGLHNTMIARDDEHFGSTGPAAADAFGDIKADDFLQ